MARVIDTAPLDVSINVDGFQPSISVRGKADYWNISKVVSALKQLADEQDSCVSLDLNGVISMDTAALEGIADSAIVFKEKGRRLHLCGASSSVRCLLDKLSLCNLFCNEKECNGECSYSQCVSELESWAVDVFTLPCDISCCHEARTRVDKVAASVGFSKSHRYDIALALGEAVSNAIKYGKSPNGDSRFTVSCVATPEKLCVSVSDNGSGFSLDSITPIEDALFMESGRGIHCMKAVMDEVSFHFDRGTTVRLVKLNAR